MVNIDASGASLKLMGCVQGCVMFKTYGGTQHQKAELRRRRKGYVFTQIDFGQLE